MKTDKLLKLIQQKRVMRSGGVLPLPKAQDGIPYREPSKVGVPNITQLTPAQEIAYQRYKQSLGDVGRDEDYDLRGFWKEEGFKGLSDSGKNGVHFTDKYKILNLDSPHREYDSLSDESKYASEFDRRGQGYWTPIRRVPVDTKTEKIDGNWQYRGYKRGGALPLPKAQQGILDYYVNKSKEEKKTQSTGGCPTGWIKDPITKKCKPDTSNIPDINQRPQENLDQYLYITNQLTPIERIRFEVIRSLKKIRGNDPTAPKTPLIEDIRQVGGAQDGNKGKCPDGQIWNEELQACTTHPVEVKYLNSVINQARDFMRDWTNSPMAQKMLQKSVQQDNPTGDEMLFPNNRPFSVDLESGTVEFQNPLWQQIRDKRLENIENVPVEFSASKVDAAYPDDKGVGGFSHSEVDKYPHSYWNFVRNIKPRLEQKYWAKDLIDWYDDGSYGESYGQYDNMKPDGFEGSNAYNALGYYPTDDSRIVLSDIYRRTGEEFSYDDNLGTAGHEISHASDFGGALIPISDKNLMGKYAFENIRRKQKPNIFGHYPKLTSMTEWQHYVADPTETRARLNALRFGLKNQGIYDPFTQKAFKGMFGKYKEVDHYDPLKQLRGIYTDDQIIDMLNTISRNEPDKNQMVDNIQYGKKGGPLLKAQDGVNFDTTTQDNSFYEPLTNTIYLSDADKHIPGVGPHEVYHYWQNTYDADRNPELYQGPLKKPTIPSGDEEAQRNYWNRRAIDQEYITDDFLARNPSFHFVHPELVYNKAVNPAMYTNPYTLEGEARNFENQFQGPSPYPQDYGYKKGGSLPIAQGGLPSKWMRKPESEHRFLANFKKTNIYDEKADAERKRKEHEAFLKKQKEEDEKKYGLAAWQKGVSVDEIKDEENQKFNNYYKTQLRGWELEDGAPFREVGIKLPNGKYIPSDTELGFKTPEALAEGIENPLDWPGLALAGIGAWEVGAPVLGAVDAVGSVPLTGLVGASEYLPWLTGNNLLIGYGASQVPGNLKKGEYGWAALNSSPFWLPAISAATTSGIRGAKNLYNYFSEGSKIASEVTPEVKILSKAPVENVGSIQEMPGLHLKSTMEKNPQGLHKYIAKDGSIDTKSAMEHIKRMEGDAKYEIVLENMQNRYGANLENMPKRMDYNRLRKELQDDLWDIGTGKGQQVDRYANKDLKSFGIIKDDTFISNQYKPRSLGYEADEVVLGGYSFTNKNKFIGGSDAHNMPKETLGHVRSFTNPKEPGVYYSAERQSNWAQEAGSTLKDTDIELLQRQQKRLPELIKEQDDLIAAGNDTWAIGQKERLENQLKEVNAKIDLYNRYANASKQEKLVMKNMNERMLQEDVAYAASQGHTKYRLPSEETTAKIQGWIPRQKRNELISYIEDLEHLKTDKDFQRIGLDDILSVNDYGTKRFSPNPITKREYLDLTNKKIKELESLSDIELDKVYYTNEQSTILKHTSQSLKDAEKLFGVKLKPITDSKGNTWYEFDIPKSFREGKGEIKAFRLGGSLPKAQLGKYIPSWLNPKNYGVPDYSVFGSFNDAFAGAKGNNENQFMWNGNRYTTELKNQKTDTPENKFNTSLEDYTNWVKAQEARNNWDDKLKKFIIHKDPSLNEISPEGGYTIGYGHKIQEGEDMSRYYKGFTEDEALQLLRDDIMSSYKDSARLFNDAYSKRGITFDKLNTNQQLLLTDYRFQGAWKWEKFRNAIVDYNLAKTKLEKERAKKIIAKEYGRIYTEPKTNKKKFTKERNKQTIYKFLIPEFNIPIEMFGRDTYAVGGERLNRYQDENSQPGRTERTYIQVPDYTINPDSAYTEKYISGNPGEQPTVTLGSSSIPQIWGVNISTPIDQNWNEKNTLGVNTSGTVPQNALTSTEGFVINPNKQVYSSESEETKRKTKNSEWNKKQKGVFGEKSQEFLKGLGYYAPKIQQDFGLTDAETEELMKVTFGIYGSESNFQYGLSYKLKSAFRKPIDLYKSIAPDWLNGDESSIGPGQIKLNAAFDNPEKRELLAKYGITKDNLWDSEIASAAILLLTAHDYKTLNKLTGINFGNTDSITLKNVLYGAYNKGIENALKADFSNSVRRTKKQKAIHLLHGDKDWNNDYEESGKLSGDDILRGLQNYSNLHLTGNYQPKAQSFGESLDIDYDTIKRNAQNTVENTNISIPASIEDYWIPNMGISGAPGSEFLMNAMMFYQNPNLQYNEVKQNGGTSKIHQTPMTYPNPLKLAQIKPVYHRNIVIDNYSPIVNYIVQGDKVYMSKKNQDNWVDISDNNIARKNLYNFLNDKYQMKGYSEDEKNIFNLIKNNQYDYKKRFAQQPVDQAPVAVNNKIPASQLQWSSGSTSTSNAKLTASVNKNMFNPVAGPVVKAKKSIYDAVGEELLGGYNFVKDLIDVGTNKVKRTVAVNTGDTDDIEIPTVKVKDSDRPLGTIDYYNKYKTDNDLTYIDLPGTDGQQLGSGSIDLSTVKFKARNLGDYTPFTSDGLFITTAHPFLKPDDPYYSKSLTDNNGIIGVDTNGNFVAGTYGELKNRKDILISRAPLNQVVSFDEDANGFSITKPDDNHHNTKFEVPIITVLDEKDNKKTKKGALNVLVTPKNEGFYGSVQGGKFIIQNPDTKKYKVIIGSLKELKQQFKKVKGNSAYANIYILDNGTYGKGLAYKDKQFTAERLKAYDKLNARFAAGSGGSGLYITGYGVAPSKYREEYYQSPSVRTEKEESFKKGHALKNEMKKIVLHWTAYSPDAKGDWTIADKNLHNEFMTYGKNNAHMAILTNGTRRIYASPEQVTFHAGTSRYDNRDNVNDFSYGIELQNPGNDKGGYAPPLTPSQLESTIEAISKLLDRYNLTLKDIITHKEIRSNYINFYSGKRNKDGSFIVDPEKKGAKSDIDDRMYNTIINGLKARGYK